MKSWLTDRLPHRDALLAQRWLRPAAHRLADPALWHFNRWSVSRGLALGLFLAFLVPLGQIVIAASVALVLRANLVVAAAATMVTNPLTFPAIYYGAYRFGQRLLGGAASPEAAAPGAAGWLLQASAPIAAGLFVFAVASAFAGYAGAQLAWRLWVRRRWAARRAAPAV